MQGALKARDKLDNNHRSQNKQIESLTRMRRDLKVRVHVGDYAGFVFNFFPPLRTQNLTLYFKGLLCRVTSSCITHVLQSGCIHLITSPRQSKHAHTQVCTQGCASAMCHRSGFSCRHLPRPLAVFNERNPLGLEQLALYGTGDKVV